MFDVKGPYYNDLTSYVVVILKALNEKLRLLCARLRSLILYDKCAAYTLHYGVKDKYSLLKACWCAVFVSIDSTWEVLVGV